VLAGLFHLEAVEREGKWMNSDGRGRSFVRIRMAKSPSIDIVVPECWYFDYGLAPDVPVRVTEEVSTLEEGNTTPCKPYRTTEATNPISSSKPLFSYIRDLTLL
jgi:hypothetical protein